jgi:hypothetical protein
MWQASGEFCWRIFGGFGEKGSGQSRGEKSSSSPVLCASMGRRRHMVSFKTTPFLLFFLKKMYETTLFFAKRTVFCKTRRFI